MSAAVKQSEHEGPPHRSSRRVGWRSSPAGGSNTPEGFLQTTKTREKESTEAHARNKSDERVAVVVKLVSVLIK